MTEAERVANELRSAILSGEMPEGSRFPSISQIMARFNIKKSAVEQALRTLRAEGLIVTSPGAPTQVKRFARIDRDSGRLKRAQWGAGRAIQDHDTGNRWRGLNVTVDEVPAPEFVAEKLGIPAGALVLSRHRTFEVDDRPVQISTSYIPVELARGTAIVYNDTGPGGIYGRLDERGFGPESFVEEVIVRAASPVEVETLRLGAVGARVFEITRSAYASDGRCVEVNRMVLDVDAYRLVNRFSS